MAANNSLWSLSAVPNRVNTYDQSAYQKPLVCEGITSGQWYQPNGALFPLATPDPVTTPGGLGQQNVSVGVELYRGVPLSSHMVFNVVPIPPSHSVLECTLISH